MKLWDNITERLFGATIDRLAAARIQAADTGLDEPGFRKLTGTPIRALDAITQERMIEICYHLWKRNPLGNWMIEVVKSFVLAEGLPYTAKSDRVKEVLDGFWHDPLNRMDLYLDKHVRELGIFGEQIWPAFTAEHTGRMRLGYTDPASVRSVITDPENVKITIGVTLKSRDGISPGKRYRTVLDPEAEQLVSEEARAFRESCDGETFFFPVNNVTNEPRGTSDLFVVADWLDGYEEFLFDYLDKWPLLNSFVWDVELQDMDEAQITDWLKKNPPPKAGSLRAHNQKAKWQAVTPDIKAYDANAGARLLRNHVLGAKGLPEHWYGGGGDVNRATAAEMGLPAYKLISDRQRTVKYMLEHTLSAAVRKARSAGYLRVSDEEAFDFAVMTPEISQDDIGKLSTSLNQLSSALVVAENSGWIDKATARRMFAFGAEFVGYDLDPDAVADAVEEAELRKGYEDAAREAAA